MAGGERRSEVLARLPRLGFGGASVGNLYAPVSDAQARAVIDAALAAGIGYFDTAPHYGFGLSEARLGQALAGRDVMISTKVGRRLEPITTSERERHGFVDAAPFEPVFDYTHDGVMRSFEDSLRRLKRDRVDVLLVHDLGRMTHGDAHAGHLRDFLDGGYRALSALKDAGAVGAIGLGVNEQAVCEEILDHIDVDVFLLAGRYTLLEQTALDSFLPRCAARGVGIIVGGPFNSGALVEPGGRLHYNYAAAPADVVERVGRLRRICAAHGVPLAAAALQFPLAHPAVLSVIPGMASCDQVVDATRWFDIAIPDGLWSDLRAEGLVRADAPTPSHASRRMKPILLHPDDNVLVLAEPIKAGQAIQIDGASLSAPGDVAVGHKIARRPLAVGDKVLKYGAPIGSMTAPAAAGEHVHMHNMKSDYIASHTRLATGGGQGE